MSKAAFALPQRCAEALRTLWEAQVTETVYRRRLRPVIEDAAAAIDLIFPADGEDQGDDDDGAPGRVISA